ncbi:hypothetical protein J7426_14275 [Tropicibacter sp. R16_0]|uniref:hypothetical protein n=1 Tax=Tropicibacter sp. R16_0 TaxID=2821102 RepID=UPI001ADA42EC|nr:hypothetical protein [Tropicibacter sp. R16_0]MBO9451436.1 hypothetical protein [Tropicibacter sp. R16_0]
MTNKPKFDATINLGHVLTMVTLLIGGAAAYTSIQVSITKLQLEIKHAGGRMFELESDVKGLSERVRMLEMNRLRNP